MIVSAADNGAISPAFVDGSLSVIVFALAFAFPRMGWGWFRRVEQVFGKLARRRGWAVFSVGASALLLRLAMLPLCPIPLPFVPDDFSFLLSADTFLHGRLANPTPAMWTHFESIQISMKPTYGSMYFPATGLVLAAGKVLTGHAWFGLLAATALMCAAICWMLQAWLPPGWALAGGAIAVLRIGLFSYWINTYHGGGSISALGGALVLGALPRLLKTVRTREGMLLALGIVLLMLNRPYEGFLLCVPVAAVLGRWAFSGTRRPAPALLARRAALPLALVVAAAAWLGYYDYRAFGKATTLPYTVNRNTYAVTPYFLWQPEKPVPAYRHQAMRTFYTVNELKEYTDARSLHGFAGALVGKTLIAVLFFAGPALFPIFIMLPRALGDRRIRFLALSVALLAAGMLIQIFLIPHYLAPFTAAFYAIGLQSARHLRLWSPGGNPVGLSLVRSMLCLCLLLAGIRLFAAPLHLSLEEWPPSRWLAAWYGPGHFGVERARIETGLEKLPGKQLVLVRYAPGHEVFNEWVYNSAEIPSAKVIWAREMDAADNAELLSYYKDRRAWLVEPDAAEPTLAPYPAIASPPATPATGGEGHRP